MDNSSKLNNLDEYQQLLHLSKRIGFEITKVVFRGYHTSNQLQRLHEQAVEKRTALKVQMEAEQQSQDLTDSKLLNEQQRNILRKLKVVYNGRRVMYVYTSSYSTVVMNSNIWILLFTCIGMINADFVKCTNGQFSYNESH